MDIFINETTSFLYFRQNKELSVQVEAHICRQLVRKLFAHKREYIFFFVFLAKKRATCASTEYFRRPLVRKLFAHI